MHTHAKNGIGVSVINGTTNCSALGVELDNGLILARVPHGPVKVRISAQHDCEVQIYFEDKKRVATTLPAGVHTLANDSEGKPLLFAAPSESDLECMAVEDDNELRDTRDSDELPDYVKTALDIIAAANGSQVKSQPAVAAVNPSSDEPDEDELSFSAVTAGATSSTTVDTVTNSTPTPASTPVEKLEAKRQLSRGFMAVIVKYAERPAAPGTVPPSFEEAVVTFQINAPEKHNKAVGANFHRIVPPEPTTKKWCSCCNH